MLIAALLLAIKLLPPTTDAVFRQPHAISAGDFIGVVVGSGDDIYYASSTNDGQTFSRPRRLATHGKLALGNHRGPQLAYQGGNLIVSAVVGKKGNGADGNLLCWLSKDSGKTWLDPVPINDVPNSARSGFHAMAAGNGMVVAVWLDQRQPGVRLYGAKSEDGGANWSKNFLIYESPDGSISESSQPSLFLGPGGAVYVMWRNWIGGNRDMYLTVSRDGTRSWEIPVKFGRESWKIATCPGEGGALTVTGASEQPYSVWRREKTIFVATTLGKESPLGEGKDPDIAVGLNEELVAVWTAPDGSIVTRSTSKDEIRTLAPKGAHPRLLFTGRSYLVFFEEGDGIAMAVVD